MKSVDLSGRQVVSRRDVLAALSGGAEELVVDAQAALTLTARAVLEQRGCALRRQEAAPWRRGATGAASGLLGSPEAVSAAKEIVAVGRKLWQRQYVDGNGGNISCRIADGLVVCTPTLLSKGDLGPEDMCLVDLAGRQIAGSRGCTSEIRMHLAIYRAVPEAKAIVHSHPPHATAYAITGRIPPDRLIPEYEVFVGQVALAKYETPGTQAFAESVLPHVRTHNTVLLANHGVVCWADSVTRAEWLTEIVDSYCWLLILAAQMRRPLSRIPRAKAAELVAVRRLVGAPDRLPGGRGAKTTRGRTKAGPGRTKAARRPTKARRRSRGRRRRRASR